MQLISWWSINFDSTIVSKIQNLFSADNNDRQVKKKGKIIAKNRKS